MYLYVFPESAFLFNWLLGSFSKMSRERSKVLSSVVSSCECPMIIYYLL